MAMEADSEIDELQRLTEKMFSLAVQGEWDELEAYEARRVAIIGSCVAMDNDADQLLAAKLRHVIIKNAEIVALAVTEKGKIADELLCSRSFEKAEKAYRLSMPLD